jgi:hypothetical protein
MLVRHRVIVRAKSTVADVVTQRAYKVREKPKVHASFDNIAHSKAGDLDTGKAWRSLRRPSDIVSGSILCTFVGSWRRDPHECAGIKIEMGPS